LVIVKGKARNKPLLLGEVEDEDDLYEIEDEPHPAIRICDYL